MTLGWPWPILLVFVLTVGPDIRWAFTGPLVLWFFVWEKKAQISCVVTFCAADPRICFRYIDGKIHLHEFLKSEVSSLSPSSVVVQPGFCRTWSHTPKTGFLVMHNAAHMIHYVFFQGRVMATCSSVCLLVIVYTRHGVVTEITIVPTTLMRKTAVSAAFTILWFFKYCIHSI